MRPTMAGPLFSVFWRRAAAAVLLIILFFLLAMACRRDLLGGGPPRLPPFGDKRAEPPAPCPVEGRVGPVEGSAGGAPVLGGAAPPSYKQGRRPLRPYEGVVVDTLNLTHWLHRRSPRPLTPCLILGAIEEAAPRLRLATKGRIVFVLKDRETATAPAEKARARALFLSAAQRLGVDICLVERSPAAQLADDEPRRTSARNPASGKESAHASLGRDDFYLLLLASRLGARVLSLDRFRDLPAMKAGGLPPFHTLMFRPGRPAPVRDYVQPAAPEFRRLRLSPSLPFEALLPHL